MVNKWTIIGGGVMAEAFLAGVLARKLVTPANVVVGEPVAERRNILAKKYEVTVTADNRQAIADADALLLAVKPQTVAAVMADLGPVLSPQTLVLSIVAGLPIAAICQHLPARAVVRIMPNTPAQAGEGMSVWVATPETSDAQKEWARTILDALGEELELSEEKYIDMATAISGSGPAYVFLFVEALADAGVHLGFSRDVALKLAWQTVRGSAIYGQGSGQHPAVLRNMVTSPGGTTAEALNELEQAGFRAALSRAVWACYEKAVALGKGAH
ncbi:MAG: pyrroline-5-carboxylate reductase [Anaerolineae bacterium]